jgi:hypothetical protein
MNTDKSARTPGANDLLDMAYINSLPQPFVGRMLGGYWWPIYDLEVETGLVRIDVCGLLDVKHISDFTAFRDDTGYVHPAEGFYIDATQEERNAPAFAPDLAGVSRG